MIGGKDVHRSMALVAEAAILMASAALHVREVSILSMSEGVVAWVRIENRIALMATLTMFSDIVTHRTARFRFRGSQTVKSRPIIAVVRRDEILLRFVTLRAFVADQSLAVAIHTGRHIRQMTCTCGLVF
jgi:hypothetical protein